MKPGHHVEYSFGSQEKQFQTQHRPDIIVAENPKALNKLAPGLKTGQLAHYRSMEGNLFIEFDNPKKYTGWTEGKLVLRNDPMPVLLKRMERWYSVKFNIIDKQISEYTYWGTFEEENLDQVLNLLSLTGPVKFNIRPRQKQSDGTYEVQLIDVVLD